MINRKPIEPSEGILKRYMLPFCHRPTGFYDFAVRGSGIVADRNLLVPSFSLDCLMPFTRSLAAEDLKILRMTLSGCVFEFSDAIYAKRDRTDCARNGSCTVRDSGLYRQN